MKKSFLLLILIDDKIEKNNIFPRLSLNASDLKVRHFDYVRISLFFSY
jgi:hypothetical protein